MKRLSIRFGYAAWLSFSCTQFCFTVFLCLPMFRSSVASAIGLISTTFQQGNPGVYLKIEENSFLVHDHNNAIGNERAQSLSACSMICTRQELCQSANFMFALQRRERKHKRADTYPRIFLLWKGMHLTIYLCFIWTTVSSELATKL